MGPPCWFSADSQEELYVRGVGWGPGGQSPPEFGRSVNPIRTRGGGRFCPSNYCQPPWIHKAIYTSVCDILNKATLAIGMSCALIKITAIHSIDPIPSLNNRTGKFAYVLYYNTFCSICLYVEVSYWSVLCTSHETCRISTKCDRQRS